MSQNHELRLNINAASAKRGAAEFKGAIASVKAAVRDLDRDTDGVFTSLRNVKLSVDTSAYKRAQNDAKALGTAAKQSADQRMKLELAAASAMRTSQSQADRLYEKLSRLGDTQGITKLTLDLAKLQTRLAAASTPLDVRAARSQFADTASEIMQTNRSLELQERAQNIAATAASSHAEALDRLRAKYNPLYAASQQYETALNEIARAEQQGAISAQMAGDARTRAAQQLQSASGVMTKYGTAMQAAGHQTQNAAYQLQDIFVSAEMAQNPLRIALQQGTQLSVVMSDMARTGGGAKGALAGLAGGIASMINPISLVTIAGVAAAAMLTQWVIGASSAEEKTEELSSKIYALSTALDSLESNTQASATQISQHLRTAFGEVATDVQALISDLREAEFSVISHQMRGEIEAATSELNRLGGAFEVFWQDFMDPGSVDAGYLNQIQKIISDSGVAYEEFLKLDEAVKSVFTSKDVNDFVKNMATARSLAAEIGGPLGDQIAAALLKAASESGMLNRVMADANSQTVAWASNLSGVRAELSAIMSTLGNIGGGLIGNASKFTELEALKAGKGLRESAVAAERMRKEAEWAGRSQGAGLLGRAAISAERAIWEQGIALDSQLAEARASARKRATASSGSGGGSRSKALSEEARHIKSTTDAIKSRHEALRAEARAMELVATGHFATIEAAQLYAEAELSGAKTTDKKTLAMLAQIDAAEALKEAQAGGFAQVQEDMQGTFKDALSGALQGDFDLSNIANGIRASIADAMAEQITEAIFPADNGATQVAQMQQALTSGGAAAAQQIRSAMTGGATAIQTAGMTSATSMATGVSTGSAAGASQMQAGIVAGSSQGAGMMARATSSGGLGGIFGGGNWLGMAMGLGSALLSNRSSNNSAPAFVEPVHSSSYYGPKDVPSYAEGTANTSGIPATLHPNEAVIPLSRGRKVPVDMGGATGGAVTLNVENHVTVEGSGNTDEDATKVAVAIQTQLEAMIDEKLIDNMQYGGYLNQRGTF